MLVNNDFDSSRWTTFTNGSIPEKNATDSQTDLNESVSEDTSTEQTVNHQLKGLFDLDLEVKLIDSKGVSKEATGTSFLTKPCHITTAGSRACCQC